MDHGSWFMVPGPIKEHVFISTDDAMVAGIAQSVLRLATGLTTEGSEFESLSDEEFSLLHVVQTGSETHSAFYPTGTVGSSPGEKRPVREADHSSPTNVEVTKKWIYTSTPPYDLHRDIFTLLMTRYPHTSNLPRDAKCHSFYVFFHLDSLGETG
jgi:hypothetical protein